MNSKRTDFIMQKSYQTNITAYWLLGFIEGEASFSVRRTSGNFELSFALSQAATDETLMKAIKEFFNKNIPGATNFESGVVNMSLYTPKNISHKQVIQLVITRKNYINDVLIPFFELLVWRSKKKLDFLDWVNILKLKTRGHHYQEEGIILINRILSQMNNYRLSTYNTDIKIDSKKLILDINNLLLGPSNLEIREGKHFIKSLNRFEGTGKYPSVELLENNGRIIKTFASVSECARFLGLSRNVVYNSLNKGKAILFDNKCCYIKREDK